VSTQEKLIQEFASLETWEEKYEKLIHLGRDLPDLPEKHKTEDHKIRGCQSRVWLVAELDKENKLLFQAQSDSMLVKGLLSILLGIYSGLSPAEVLNTSPDFISKIGFDTYLSPTRANGLAAVLKQIKIYALGYQAILFKNT